MTRQEWDSLWCRWYERAVKRGKTPNEAIPIAYREMSERFGDRPPEAKETNE